MRGFELKGRHLAESGDFSLAILPSKTWLAFEAGFEVTLAASRARVLDAAGLGLRRRGGWACEVPSNLAAELKLVFEGEMSQVGQRL